MKYIKELHLNINNSIEDYRGVSIKPNFIWEEWFVELLNQVELFKNLETEIFNFCEGYTLNYLYEQTHILDENYCNYLSKTLVWNLEAFLDKKMEEILSEYDKKKKIEENYYVFKTIDGRTVYFSSGINPNFCNYVYNDYNTSGNKKKENRI